MEVGGGRNVTAKTKEIQINKRCQSDELGIFFILFLYFYLFINK